MCGEVERERKRESNLGAKEWQDGDGRGMGGISSHERSWKAWRTEGKPSWDHFLSLTSPIDCLCRIINFFPSLLLPVFTPPKPLSSFSGGKAAWAGDGRREGKGREGDAQEQLPFSWAHYNIKETLNDHISEAFPKHTAPCSPKGLQAGSTPCPLQWMWLQLLTGDIQLLTPASPLSCQSFTELGKKGIALSSNIRHYQRFWVFIWLNPLCLITWLRLLCGGQNWIWLLTFKEEIFLKNSIY